MATAAERAELRRERRRGTRDDDEQAVAVALVVLLLAGLPLPAFTANLVALLAPLGIPATAVIALVQRLGDRLTAVPPPAAPPGSVQHAIQRSLPARRALFILAAARRLAAKVTTASSPAPTDDGSAAEERLFGAHEAAELRREAAAARIDAAAERHGPLLGWYARMDDRTTALCRAAHGRNWRVDRPPEIGYPGMMHAGTCRCRPGPPWPDGTLLPTLA